MATTFDAYVGCKDEVTYGTAIAVTRFFEFVSEGVNGTYERVESETVRAGTRVLRSDRFQPTAKGAEGDLKLEVMDTNIGFFLKHMLGTVATTGAADPYTHTATVGSLTGKSFTMQIGRVAVDGNLYPFTYQGCKIKSWELSNSVDQVLQLSLDIDAQAENAGAGAGALAAATPTFPATGALMTFTGGAVTIGGTSVAIMDASVKGENNLKTDRWFLGNTKKEPLEDGMREFSFDLKAEFSDLTQYNRIKSLTAAGAVASVSLVWSSPTAGHSLTVTIPAARFDEGAVNVDGVKNIEQSLTGKAVYDGTNSAVTIAYATSDATP